MSNAVIPSAGNMNQKMLFSRQRTLAINVEKKMNNFC